MSTKFYSPASWLPGGLRPRLAALATALLLAPAAWAQIEVPAGNPNGGAGRRPLGTYFGYERSAMIYTAAEIGTSGNLTRVGFYLNAASAPGAAPTKIYLKTVTNATFAAPTTVAAEETGATLVYDAAIPAGSFTANTWVSVPLTAPFAYNGTSNLEVIVETNATGGGNEGISGKEFRYSSTGTGNNRTQLWQADNTAPAGPGTPSALRPNIQLTGLTPLACPPVSGVSVSSITTTSAQVAFTPAASSSSYTVTYTPAGGTATTITPAPTASPIALTGLTPGTLYTVTIVGNCTGSTTSPVVTLSFRTLFPTPANDDCAGAVTLTSGATCTPTSGTLAGATQSNAPILCAGLTAATAQDVWYKFTATAAAHVIAVTGNFDGVMEVLGGAACGSLTNVGCADASAGNNETLTLSALTVGTTYYVRYYSFSANPPNGAFTICVTLPLPAPANDNCAGALALTSGATCTVTTGTNTGATASTGAPAPSATLGCFLPTTPINNDVWYSIVVPASGALTVTTSAITGSLVNDTGLALYTGTCGTLTEVACSDDISTTDFFSSAIATGLTAGATIYARVWSFGNTPTGQFGICATVPAPLPANDAAVQAIYSLGTVSSTYGSPVTVRAVIRNAGSAALTNVPVTLTVTGATTFTDAKIVPALAVGASATVTFAAYPVTAASGTNTLTVTIPADGVATNNSQTQAQTVSATTLSYAVGTTFTGGVGVAAINTVIAVRHQTSVAASVRTVTPNFFGTGTGTYQVLVYNVDAAGLPGTVLYTSPARPRPAAGGPDAVALPGVNVNGPFFVGLQNTTAGNIGISYQTEEPLRAGTFLYRTATGTGWIDVNTSTLNSRVIVDVTLGAVLANKNAIGAGTLSVFPNPAHEALTLRLPAIAGQRTAQLTLLNTLGQQVKTRTVVLNAAGTETQVDVSGLAAGIYTLRVQTNDQVATTQVVVE